MTIIKAQYCFLGQTLEFSQNVIVEISHNNIINEIFESKNEIKNNLLLMPGFFNSHVHTADIKLRNKPKLITKNLMKTKRGNINYLKNITIKQAIEDIQTSKLEAINNGILGWADFRDGDLKGLKSYKDIPSSYRAFGMIQEGNLEKLKENMHLGLNDVRSDNLNGLKLIAKKRIRYKKLLQIHVSNNLELRNYWMKEFNMSDLIWSVRNLNPDTLIHLTNIDENDLSELVKNDKMGVICLSSNNFGKIGKPPILKLMESGIILGIGTDNAMLNELNLWEEMRLIAKEIPKFYFPRLISMATVEGAETAGINWGIELGLSNIMTINFPKKITSYVELINWLINEGNSSFISEIWQPENQMENEEEYV